MTGVHLPIRRFVLDRSADITGISGTGIILYGVEWYPGGPVDVYWLKTRTTGQYPSMDVVRSTHCYNDNARVIYLDDSPAEREQLLAIKEAAQDVLDHLNYLDRVGSLTREDEPALNGLRKAFGQQVSEE